VARHGPVGLVASGDVVSTYEIRARPNYTT